MSETNDLNRQVIDLCNYRGGFAWRNNVGSVYRNGRMVQFSRVGSGDVLGVYHGLLISIETKTGRDKARPAQIKFASDVHEAGGFACFVTDIDEAIEFLESIDKFVFERSGGEAIPF
jgi:penicillin-binding protein-related factor A (putative recombinase)